jgi:hypothetical protein
VGPREIVGIRALKGVRLVRVPLRAITGLSMIVVLTMVLLAVAPGIGFAIAAVPSPSHESGPNVFAVSSVTSSNWAGYVARNTSGHATHTVTMSAGTWVQPGVNCSAGKQTDVSTWVGIHGYSTTTVEQTGSSGDCNGGVVSYYAWYELYPAPSQTISSLNVHSGDTLSACVNYSSSTEKFTMMIRDGSQSFSKTGAASGAKRASAECIVERDTVGSGLNDLSKFPKDKFTTCTATINGITGGIGTFPQVDKINMTNSGTVIAATSALSSGNSFYVTWKGYG